MSIAYWSQEIIQKQTCLYHHRVSKVIRREVPGTQPRESVGLVPSLISWNHLFYKAEYMGWSCPNQVGAITFGWSALATWNKHSWTAFWKLFSGIPHLPGFGDVPVLCAMWYERWASGESLKSVFNMQFRNAYFRSLVHSSQKLWHKPDEGNHAPSILPCKIGGSQNLMKEPFLSKTPFLKFVYLSTCKTNLPGIFGNSEKKFLWTGPVHMLWHSLWGKREYQLLQVSNKSIQTNKLRLIWELPLSGAHHTAVQSYSFKRWAVTCTFVVLWLGRLIWSNSKHSLHYWQSPHVLWRTLDNPLTNFCHNLQFALLAFLSYLVLFLIGSLLNILVILMHLVGVGLYVILFGRT